MVRRIAVLTMLTGCASVPPPASTTAPMIPTVEAPTVPTVSYLQSLGESGCAWIRFEAPKSITQFAEIDQPCGGTQLAWSADRRYGAMLAGGRDVIVVVDFALKQSHRISTPTLGLTKDVGFDAQGLVALVMTAEEHGVVQREENNNKVLDFRGKTYAAPSDGDAALAHALRWQGERWELTETVGSSWGWDYAAGVEALEIASTLGPRSSILTGPTHGFEVLDSPLPPMTAVTPKSTEPGQWARVGDGFVWAEEAEFPICVSPLYRVEGETMTPLVILGIPDATPMSFDVFGGIVLVRDTNGVVHLVDVNAGKVVAVVGNVFNATLWR